MENKANNEFLTGAHWGAFYARVEQARIVGVRPVAWDERPNNLIEMAPYQVNAPNRVHYPMARKSWLLGGPGAQTELRGADEWVRLSWEEAIERVGREIQRVQREAGPQAIHAGAYGWKSVGMLHNSTVLLHRLMNLAGGFTSYVGDYSTAAAQVVMPYVTGFNEVYDQQSTWPTLTDETQLLILWGTNPLVTSINNWNIPDHGESQAFSELRDTHKRVIAIDPIYHVSAKALNAEWIAPRPYTDVALMLGLAHTLYVEKWYDAEFLKRYCVGFDKFLSYLLGDSDGEVKNAEWAAQQCGLPAEQIRQLARDMATQRTLIMAGWGMQRQQHGEQVNWMLVTLSAMLGQIGLPGGGFSFNIRHTAHFDPRQKGKPLSGITAGPRPAHAPPPVPVARIADCLLNPGKSITFNGKTVTYPEIKLLYIAGGNPFQHHPDTNTLLQAWRRPETVIVHEPYWTATAKHADLVLPVTTTYERNDLEISHGYQHRYVLPLQQCVPPQFESRHDYDILQAVAAQLGVEAAFTEGRSEREWLVCFYDQMREKCAIAFPEAPQLPSFDDFWQAGEPLQLPRHTEAKQWVRFADFRANPEQYPLRTPSGKIEIFSEQIASMDYADCQGHPRWYSPREWGQSEEAQAYPLSLSTAHAPQRLHSQLDNTPLRDQFAVAGREAVFIHPEDARSRGIQSGDVVRVFNQRGQVLVGAEVTQDIRLGVIKISEGAWYDPEQPGLVGALCKNGNVNCLTFDAPASSLSQGNCGHMAQVQIEKYTDNPPKNSAYETPAVAKE